MVFSNIASNWALFAPKLSIAPHLIRFSIPFVHSCGVNLSTLSIKSVKLTKGPACLALTIADIRFSPTFLTAVNPNRIFPLATVNLWDDSLTSEVIPYS